MYCKSISCNLVLLWWFFPLFTYNSMLLQVHPLHLCVGRWCCKIVFCLVLHYIFALENICKFLLFCFFMQKIMKHHKLSVSYFPKGMCSFSVPCQWTMSFWENLNFCHGISPHRAWIKHNSWAVLLIVHAPKDLSAVLICRDLTFPWKLGACVCCL